MTVITASLLLAIVAVTRPLSRHATGAHPTTMRLDDLAVTQSPLILAGEITTLGNGRMVSSLILPVTIAPGETLNVSAQTLRVDYRDHQQRVQNLPWSIRFQGEHDQDMLLEPGEVVQVVIPLHTALGDLPAPHTEYIVELVPTDGALLSLAGTIPAEFEQPALPRQ